MIHPRVQKNFDGFSNPCFLFPAWPAAGEG
jgi:hypothetical protein